MLLPVRSRWFLALFLLLPALRASAQSGVPFGFEQRAVAKVTHGSQTLANPWVGGLNSPQFSAIDLNNDGQSDLYIFDRQASRSLTYLNVAAPGGGRAWQYAPEYEALFPADLLNWVLLRDYDCDNRPDIFTFANGGDIRVFRNVAGASGRPSFELVSNQLAFFNNATNNGNIVTGGSNLPAIQDINGDGRLDILSFDFGSSTRVELYLNTAAGTCGNLQFRQEASRWGNFSVCLPGCSTFAFGNEACAGGKPTHTTGSNLLTLDLDGDGDQDILTSRDACPELVSLTNQGTAAVANMTSASLNTNFPSTAAPVRVINFPAAFYLDVTFDGRPDLIAAPALFDNHDQVSTTQSVRLYENSSASAVPSFTLRQPDFLQADMVDVSEAATPAFGDLSGDGLTDMLVAGTERRAAGYAAYMHYYRNIGTATEPNFQRVSDDYLALGGKKYTGIKPVLVDLNRDGALDMAFSATSGNTSQVFYVLNQAAVGQPAAFDINQATAIANLPNRAHDAPCFTDVDGDSNLDLLIGTNVNTSTSGSARYGIQYYRHNGSAALAQAYTLSTATFGQIQSTAGNLHPTVADFDGDGKPDLLTADASGELRFYADFRAQLLPPTTPFVGRADILYNGLLNAYRPAQLGVQRSAEGKNRVAPVAADLNGDGAPELLVGMEAGGITAFAARGRVLSTNPAAEAALELRLFPNPAAGTTSLEAAQPVRLTVFDLTGRRIRTVAEPARRHTFDLTNLAAGVYLVRAESMNGEMAAVRRLLVR
ncbi:T9SS type A sorting domain-containing protein [Hymenobacter sp. BT188]|uniref:T9SS type A sorting domain-containing protein n=1 Tax=Hymenobacter sp. BT188 TaxID=2763504 RepID=UPI001650DE3F|nr:T9SS type A sorting domain-containing protein [Hymenobacter sp. BT188]MBC6606134.1 T9SS type A sorting domain-containing protein [Hymenobacter sp. BT188]